MWGRETNTFAGRISVDARCTNIVSCVLLTATTSGPEIALYVYMIVKLMCVGIANFKRLAKTAKR